MVILDFVEKSQVFWQCKWPCNHRPFEVVLSDFLVCNFRRPLPAEPNFQPADHRGQTLLVRSIDKLIETCPITWLVLVVTFNMIPSLANLPTWRFCGFSAGIYYVQHCLHKTDPLGSVHISCFSPFQQLFYVSCTEAVTKFILWWKKLPVDWPARVCSVCMSEKRRGLRTEPCRIHKFNFLWDSKDSSCCAFVMMPHKAPSFFSLFLGSFRGKFFVHLVEFFCIF